MLAVAFWQRAGEMHCRPRVRHALPIGQLGFECVPAAVHGGHHRARGRALAVEQADVTAYL